MVFSRVRESPRLFGTVAVRRRAARLGRIYNESVGFFSSTGISGHPAIRLRTYMQYSRTELHNELPHGGDAGIAAFEQAPRWMAWVLYVAGVYNISAACFAFLYPPQIGYPELWRYLGAITAAYGVVYLLIAARPFQYWPIVFAGLFKALLGPLSISHFAVIGALSMRMTILIVANDVIWWIPFALILEGAYRAHLNGRRATAPDVEQLALTMRTNQGDSLRDLSAHQPLLLFFMRHTGCPFCRESLARLGRIRRKIEEGGTKLVLIHMSSDSHAQMFLSQFGLAGVARISDPRRSLYRAFGLQRGSLWQVIGPQLWARGFAALLRHGQSLSRKGGDLFQLSGLFLVFHGHVVRSFLHQTAGDMPDYAKFVC